MCTGHMEEEVRERRVRSQAREEAELSVWRYTTSKQSGPVCGGTL